MAEDIKKPEQEDEEETLYDRVKREEREKIKSMAVPKRVAEFVADRPLTEAENQRFPENAEDVVAVEKSRKVGVPTPDTMTDYEDQQLRASIAKRTSDKEATLHDKVKEDLEKGQGTKTPTSLTDLEKGVSELPSMDRSGFRQELKEIKDWYKQAQDRLERNEIIEKMAHAVTQMGAAWYGLKNGVDLSGLKFDRTDWEHKQDRMLNEFRTRLDEVQGREREATQEYQFGKTYGLHKEESVRQNKQLEELKRHNKAMEGNAVISNMLKASKGTGKDPNEDIKKAAEKVRVVYRSEDLDDDEKRAQAVNILTTDLDMDADTARERLKGGFFENDPEESMDTLTEMLKEWKYQRLTAGSSAPAGGMVKVKNKETGEIIEVPASEVGQ